MWGAAEHLSARFILISLNIVELLGRDDLIFTKSHTVIGVITVSIIGTVIAEGILAVFDDLSARFGSERKVLEIADLTCGLRSAAVPESDIAVGKQIQLGGHIRIGHIVVCGLEGGKEGSENGKKHQHGNDDTADDRALVLAEALEGALEIAYRLCLEFAVMIQVIFRREPKLFRGDIIEIIIHNHLAPILILGSMKP